MTSDRVQVRSYRTCFDLERRIHRIDRWRIPVPWGVPLRGVGYAAGALAVLLVAQGLPLVGAAVAALPAPVRLILMPVGIAVALVRIRVDGRPAHAALWAIARQRVSPRQSGWKRRVVPGEAVAYDDFYVAPDCGGGRLRRARVAGPARVDLRAPVRPRRRRRTVLATVDAGGAPVALDLAVGEVLEVRS